MTVAQPINAPMANTSVESKPAFTPGETIIPLSEPSLAASAWQHMKAALDSGWVSSVGPYVDKFEQSMAARFGVPRAIATMNGTAAIHTALNVLGVGAGDEVILPSLTFIATANAVAYTGATMVFLDSSANHFNADASQLEQLITPRTKAILPVHLYGQPVAMAEVMRIANKHGIAVIEDAAEALGASTADGQLCGTIGQIGCFSFNGNKSMTTGTGGLIVSHDEALMARAHYLINQAKDDGLRFIHDEVGYNYRLSNLHAALGTAQLEEVDTWIAQRQAITQRYNAAFANVPGVITFSPPAAGATSSDWLATMAIDPAVYPNKTNMDIVLALQVHNIQTRPFFRPIHMQKPFAHYKHTGQQLTHAEHWATYGINLPTSAHLIEAEQTFVIEQITSLLANWR
jgi:perosamine synthetase